METKQEHFLSQAVRNGVRRGQSPMIRSILLSGPQYDLLCRIHSGGIVSRQIADDLEISISSASGRLSALESLGYLDRREEVDPAGGTRYVYRPAP